MTTDAPSMAKPALIAGLLFGIAGAIPIIEWINCACCALIIGCGFVAAYLHSKPMKAAGLGFTPGNGAVVGLAAGVVYGIVAGLLGALFDMVLGLTDMSQIVEQMQQVGTMDPEAVEMVSRFVESTGPATIVFAGLFFSLLFGAVFGTLGGLIGGAVFKGEPAGLSDQVPPPPPVTPSP
jgi:hypothetical protein